MKKVSNPIGKFLLLGSMVLVVYSCSKDDKDAVEQETELSQAEVKTVLEIDEVSSAADNIVRDLFNTNKTGKSAKVDACYQAVYSETGYSVSFDNCSVEENGEILNGSLSVVYGKEGESYAYAVNFDHLMVGKIGIDGTRSFAFDLEQENSIVFDVVSDMTITMADGGVISEKGSKTFAIVFGEQFGDGMLTLEGDWTLKADGNTYAVSVPKLLEANFGCDYVGKGLMLLNKNGLEVSVDFGDGSCDTVAELAYPNGSKEDISLKK
ncbi:hypothetical protein SAMN05421636_104342 [Pricia antarctica]|uniref:Lipoprotein n=1 Tax=Pricia antarctica TaxID=641691 RepID=A0A1G7BZV0_9FLAO|nr:hypothetical protein [Pricia antarctica]SDE31946.1 hypothetical protein SAMN05421636_104342 [Pricia antarctica]